VWDEPKRKANIERHGLDFADVGAFGWDGALIAPARRERLKAIGDYRGQMATVIFVRLGREAYSIISFRPAGKKERKLYADHQAKG
jgi:uncharacterized DUF497 family protein